MCFGGNERFEVKSILKRTNLNLQGHSLTSLGKAIHYQSNLYFIDNKALEIWRYAYKDDQFLYFSGEGEGPGELRYAITSFYVSTNNLHVVNANGSRMDQFNLNGDLQKSQKVVDHFPLYFEENNILIYKKGGQYILQTNGASKISADAFDSKNYGPQVHTSRFDDFFIIASASSNNNTIPYIIFDLSNIRIAEKGSINKQQIITKDNIPDRLRSGLSGVDLNFFYFNNFQVIVTQDELGFVILEYDMGIFKSAERGYYSVVDTVNPVTTQKKRITLYHRDIEHISFLLPLKKYWIAFDAASNEMLFLEVERM